MKKLLLCLLLVILFSGCGNKDTKVNCAQKQKKSMGQYYVDFNADADATFNDDNDITSLKITFRIVIPEDQYNTMKNDNTEKENMELLTNMFKENLKNSLGNNSNKIDVKYTDNIIKLTINIDINDKEKVDSVSTIEKFKDTFKNLGYICD